MPSAPARARRLWRAWPPQPPAPRPVWRSGAAGSALATLRERRGSASLVARPSSPRRSRFDLPREDPEQTAPRYRLPERPEAAARGPLDEEEAEEALRTVRLDAVTSEDVAAHWPPRPLVAEPPVARPVRRPHLWLADQAEVGVEDVGRFVKLERDDLIELLPEGPCGQLARDLTLIPSHTRPVGLMLRKLTVELIAQLSLLRDARDAKGAPRIRKAGFLVDGRRGVGKSQVLNLLVMWARRNGWLVILEPTPSRYSLQSAEIKRSNNGVYIQSEFAQQFLEAASLANRHKLEEIPVDLSVYGTRAIDGESVKATKRLYEPLIEKTVEQEVADQGLSAQARLERIAAYKAQVRVPSMAQQLRNPVNVWEIVEFGLQNEAYATQAVSEMFMQLQRQTTHPVLVVVDEWNECFPCSQYVSIRYDNTRFHGYIPAYHLTMPRALHNWDGQLYRRGLKICATSWTRYRRRDYSPELLGVKEHEFRTVRSFSQHEFANYVTYLRLMNVLHNFPREDLAYYYMLTQGNGYESRKILTTLY